MKKATKHNRKKLRSRLVHTLELRWEKIGKFGTWVYDEPSIGLFGEPLVLGADRIASTLRQLYVGGYAFDPFKVVFSEQPLPGAVEFTRDGEQNGGAWYVTKLNGTVHEGWLCAHLHDYFKKAPKTVYVRAEAVEQAAEYAHVCSGFDSRVGTRSALSLRPRSGESAVQTVDRVVAAARERG